ncbi:unnamed protein product [Cercopithifilaria johnstoni]|uniref:Uncharacterized protein n=1 Tax=Cercopithifilaria johnstoni TaxID=2874296 RepID=A0A8J2M2E7_9BILA|nr:unnamed protein product [Cercopithifilaria johnstoni]
MTVVFFGFGILLLYGFYKLKNNLYFLLAGIGSVLAALFYMINVLVTIGLLRQDITDIVVNEKALKQMSCITNDDLNHFSISVISEHDKAMGKNQQLKGKPIISIENTSAILMSHQDDFHHLKSSIFQASLPADQRFETDQHIIDYIREELDQRLDNEVNRHDNSSTNYSTGHCTNSNSTDTIDDVVMLGSRERYRYASARNNNISKSSARCNQKLQQRSTIIWNQVSSRRKVTPIPLFAPAEAENLDDNHIIEHFNAHFLATQKHDPLIVHRIPNNVKSDTTLHVSRPVELSHRQHQHLPNKTAEECGIIIGRHYSKGKDDNSRPSDNERFLNDNSKSVSFVGPICYYNNSAAAEIKNLDLAVQPELFIAEVPSQNIRNYSRSGSDDSSSQQMSIMALHTYGRRGSGRGSQRRCYSKHDNRLGSGDIQHPSYTTYAESNDKGSLSFNNYRSDISGRQKISNLSREQESVDPSCMPSIVTAIDSGRESDIIRKNSPKRTSSRDRKIRNRGFDMVIGTQSGGERFASRRRTLSASSSSYDKPIEAYLVTEF